MPGEKFSVRLLPEDGGQADRVMVEVGMDGFNVLSSDGSRTLRKYPLTHISRWSMRGSSLILFTRSPVDVEDRSLTLQGDEHTIRSVLDSLTSCCMQMAELLQSGGGGGDRNAANSLSALLKKSKKAVELPTADQVEFWRSPEKAGWMHSQGEHIKTWRKRWFVLKKGFLFRFSSPEVTAATKPRGIVDLSQVTDVSDGSATSGRPLTVKLSTATGSKCYITESETAQVEWISVLEDSIAKILKIVAGVDDEDATPSATVSRVLSEQFRSYSGQSSGGGGGDRTSSQHNKQHGRSRNGTAGGGRDSQMLSVVNYGGGGGGSIGHQQAFSASPSAPISGGGYAAAQQQHQGGDYGYIRIDYGGSASTSSEVVPSAMGGFQVAPPETGSGGGGGGMYGQVYSPPPAAAAAAGGAMVGNYQSYGGGGGGDGGYGGGYAPQQAEQQQYHQHHQQHYYQQQQPAAQPGFQQQQQQQPSPQQQQQQQPQYYQIAAPDYGAQMQAGGGGSQVQQQGGTLMDAVTMPESAPVQSSSPWQVHYAADGRPYYYNLQTQITQWEAPAA